MNALEISGLTLCYKDFALEDVSFSLPAGCVLGLIGENGAGKSTTIQIIMNAIRWNAGTVSVLGVDNRSPEFLKVKQDIGVVLDEAAFPETLNVCQIAKVMSLTYTNWDKEVFASYVQRFSLPEKKSLKKFSRGMKMKLSIAVALSHHAKLLVLDEATGGLDPIVRDEVLDCFNDFTRDEEHSILISSHIVSDLEKICDYIAFLHEGKLLFCEEKDRLEERFGVLHCAKEELERLPAGAVQGHVRYSSYGTEALVQRGAVPAGMKLDSASIEDIIVFLGRKEEQR